MQLFVGLCVCVCVLRVHVLACLRVFVPACLCKHSEHASPSMCVDKNTVISYLTPGLNHSLPSSILDSTFILLCCLTDVKEIGMYVVI